MIGKGKKQRQEEERREIDAARERLMQVWGPNYQSNMAMIKCFVREIDYATGGAMSIGMSHKGINGRAIGNDEKVAIALCKVARDWNR